MKKGNLFSTIAFIFSFMLLIVSGAIYVYSAQQQSVSSSLQVTYEARNVSFTADAWYEKPSNSGTKQAFSGNTLTINATAAESTTSTLSVDSDIILNANPDTYVLFTYKFVNTASNGGYDMLVSLTDDATKTNVNVKYYTAVTSGTNPTMYNSLSTQVGTVRTSGIASVPSAIYVPAQSSLLYYILVEIDNNTIGSTYATGNNNEITWNVSSANTKGAVTPAVTYNANGGVQQNNSTPTRDGYTFGGWNTSPDGTGTSYTSEDAASWAGQPIVLYAVWEEEEARYSVTITISGYYTQLYYQLGSEDSEGPLSISRNSLNDVASGNWTQASSASFTLNDIERLYIMFGGQYYECHYTIYRGTDSSGTQVCYLITYGGGMGGERSNNYDYYYDTGVLNQDVSYYIYVNRTNDNGAG